MPGKEHWQCSTGSTWLLFDIRKDPSVTTIQSCHWWWCQPAVQNSMLYSQPTLQGGRGREREAGREMERKKKKKMGLDFKSTISSFGDNYMQYCDRKKEKWGLKNKWKFFFFFVQNFMVYLLKNNKVYNYPTYFTHLKVHIEKHLWRNLSLIDCNPLYLFCDVASPSFYR